LAFIESRPLNASLEEKLSLLYYNIDAEEKHIEIIDMSVCARCSVKWCVHLCPAKVYEVVESGWISVNYENCIECGAAPYICPFNNIKWSPPRGGYGVEYRYG